MDFSIDLDICLESLANGYLVGIPTAAGWMLTADATNQQAISALLETGGEVVVMLADKQDILRHVGNLDLNWADWLEDQHTGIAAIFGRILGIDPALQSEEGTLALALAKDKFTFHLIKRFRKPLAMVYAAHEILGRKAMYTARPHTEIIAQGFQIKPILL
jgi:tRNA A37 threonylcarbamoyladenosine synthetase subunit TsaC/SUA5/YrdC